MRFCHLSYFIEGYFLAKPEEQKKWIKEITMKQWSGTGLGLTQMNADNLKYNTQSKRDILNQAPSEKTC